MQEILEQYVDPAYVYNYSQGPERVGSKTDALRDGMNCVALAHLVLADLFDHALPPELDCYESFIDHERFTTVEVPEMEQGDLVWFGKAKPCVDPAAFVPAYDARGNLTNWKHAPVTHVAVHTGDWHQDDPLLLHATSVAGTNAIWPLSRFANHRRYARLLRVGRLAHE